MTRLRSKQLLACISLLLLCGSSITMAIEEADDCADAPYVGDVTNLRFDTRGTTFDGPGHYVKGPNIWYRYAATCTGSVTVSLMGSSFDTELAVYSGSGCYPTSNRLIASNDNFGLSLQSQVTFAAIAGDEFLIEIGGHNSAVEEGLLTISCDGIPGPAPSRDECSKALPIGDVNDLAFDTTGKTFDGPGGCMTGPNIWYCYTAPCTGDVTISLSGSSYDTMLAVYDGCGCHPTFAPNLIKCDDDSGEDRTSEITFAATAGNEYLIEVGGYASETGEGVLNVHCIPPTAPKDDCVGAEAVGNVKNLPFSTTGTTFDGPGLCLTSPNIWFCYTATCTGDVTVSLLDSAYDTMLAVYKGCECYPQQNDLIGCNDDFSSSYQSQITFAAVAGASYLIEVGGYSNETGDGILNISCDGTAAEVQPDLGDAPDSSNNSGKTMEAYPSQTAHFPTVYNDGSGVGPFGPAHLNEIPGAFLGKSITGENEADTGPDDDGINNLRTGIGSPNHDGGDDAVVLPLVLPNRDWATFNYQVTVIDPNIDLWVNVWFDFNRDGDWDDEVPVSDVIPAIYPPLPGTTISEWAVKNQFLFDLPAGLNTVTTPGFKSIHPDGTPARIWMRITLSEQPWTGGSNPGQLGNAGSGPAEKYQIGETEDYYFTPTVPEDVDCPLCEDVNGDGVINLEDMSELTSQWLANCL